jgi:putative phosphonate catabolism associated alcohol dehydrogenase
MGRAFLFHGAGRPMELVQFSTPSPRGEELLIRITCCTLCRSDLQTHAGRRSERTPTVLGHEMVGRIEAFGPTASRHDASGRPASVGDRISWAVTVGCGRCFFCAEDLPQKCQRLYKYGHVQVTRDQPWCGGLADTVILVPRTAWYRVPDQVSDRVAAPANCATATVAAVLRHAGSVAGRHVLILGAGVLGVTACAMARADGAHAVLVSDTERTCLERATAFGATHTISAEQNELAARVAEATDDRGADVVLELTGAAAAVSAGLSLVRTGGIFILAGTVSPVGHVGIDPEEVVRRMLTIRGVHNYHPRDLESALAFLADQGRSLPFESLVAAEYPLEQAEQALATAHARPGVRIAVLP